MGGSHSSNKRASKKSGSKQLPRSSVIVPLYLYPMTEETWEPLHKAIREHPELEFVVVLNPNSGPGAPPWWPEPNYVREIPRLSGCPNVRTVGYVRTEYCRRPIAETLGDIEAYGRWASDETNRGLAVGGIFFDETPNHYDKESADYLAQLTAGVRKTAGIIGKRLVVHNPGTPPDERLAARATPDVTVVSEESRSRYRSLATEEQARLDDCERARCCIIQHGVPRRSTRAVVHELRQRAAYIFVSDLGPESCYSQWGDGWDDFVAAMVEEV